MVVLQYACEEFGVNGQPLPTGVNVDPLIGMGGLRDGYPSGTLAASDGNNGNVPINLIYTKATFGTVNGANNNQNDAGTNTIQDTPPTGDANTGTYAFGTMYANTPATTAGTAAAVANTASDTEYGYHETWESYQACKNTQRNKGLYTSDQKLNRNDARSTRQNPNGNRRGLECPEERDYYPYWRPTMWKDVAVLTSNEAMCPYFQARSQNTNSRWYCAKATTANTGATNGRIPISKEACETATGVWTEVKSWAAQGYADGVPECRLHQASRQNNLGNSQDAYAESNPGEKETMAQYTWTMPTLGPGVDFARCVLRARYNISNNDYPSVQGMTDVAGSATPWDNEQAKKLEDCAPPDGTLAPGVPPTAAPVNTGGDNGGNNQGVDAPQNGAQAPPECIKPGASGFIPQYNRPYVMTYTAGAELGIAINTDQSGRTFQDRSFVFDIKHRPAGVAAAASIINLNTRGARGNIVQSYPRVEYDFVPQSLAITEDDYVHVQWSGSDFNTKRNPNNAEGWQYADRANLVETINENQQFPMAETRAGFFTKQEAMEVTLQGQDELLLAKNAEPTQRATNPTIAGKYNDGTTPRHCGYFTDNNNGNMDEDNDPRNCGKLNFAKAHFQLGGSSATGLKQASAGTYAFVDTRNNNFSNRSQKMTISVAPGAPKAAGMSAAQVAGLVFGIGIPVVCIAILALAVAGAVVAVIATGSGGAVLAFLKSGGKSAGDVADGTSASGPTKPTKSGGPPKPAQRGGPPAKPSQRGGPPAKPGKRGGPPPKPGKR